MLPGSYRDFTAALQQSIPAERLISDPLRLLTYGTDASFYRLIPKLVVKAESETDIIAILHASHQFSVPITFRAAGTSLSGQSITDSVLVLLGNTWNRFRILDDGMRISLQPGIIGATANIYLAPYGRKIGPDPASINSAMIGGIAANNASGMCCGTAQNSYHTLASMRLVLHDGSILDTGSESSRSAFTSSHPLFLQRIADLGQRVRQNTALAERIQRKYSIKNTTGYSLNALVDFEDPIDIVQHLMIGSEGTLGFIAEITYTTVPELPHKATSLIVFADIGTACRAVPLLKRCPVDAVELMDRASLRSVENKEGMPTSLRGLDDGAASLLVETRATDESGLQENISSILAAIASLPTVRPVEFTSDQTETAKLWGVRKGLFPSVGAVRRTGTTVIIEDVAFPVPRLADATRDLQRLFARHGYDDAIIFGHALEGNLHFVFKQDFNVESEVRRYGSFIADVTGMVVNTYGGSLKAEHGTGRNMSPFVELEWGAEAYTLMHEIKDLFDPRHLLNPDVILSSDRSLHLKNLKPLPAAHTTIDKCIECGFCEVQCPSKDLTLTPRQRIVAFREMTRLALSGEDSDRLRDMRREYRYYGDRTCATDGLCAVTCPVSIDTGGLIKDLRFQHHGPLGNAMATLLSGNMKIVTGAMRAGLGVLDMVRRGIGTPAMGRLTAGLRQLSGRRIPAWNRYFPRPAGPMPVAVRNPANPRIVVYFPSCINRTMGIAPGDEGTSLVSTTVSFLEKSGFEVVIPDHVGNLCCGLPFSSKGFTRQADRLARILEDTLAGVSRNGEYPVYFDMTPCMHRMLENMHHPLRVYEPARFILEEALPHLSVHPVREEILVHHTCSARKMSTDRYLLSLASRCSENVKVPRGIGCCGWAGDRGFTVPELTASALQGLRDEVPQGCNEGFSTSRTCEIGMSLHSGVHYKNIVYLVDRCTSPSDRRTPTEEAGA